jgi:hypothetical protein
MFEDIKGVIKSRKLKKDRQHNDRKKTDNRTNNDLQSTTQENKDWATQTPLKTGGELRFYRRVNSSKLFRKNVAMLLFNGGYFLLPRVENEKIMDTVRKWCHERSVLTKLLFIRSCYKLYFMCKKSETVPIHTFAPLHKGELCNKVKNKTQPHYRNTSNIL